MNFSEKRAIPKIEDFSNLGGVSEVKAWMSGKLGYYLFYKVIRICKV